MKKIKQNNHDTFIGKIIISVDNAEWYYGKEENLKKPEKRKLITRIIQENEVVSQYHAKFINDIFSFIEYKERNTAKRKKRDFYVDVTLFL